MPLYVLDWLEDREVKKMKRAARSMYLDLLCHEWIGGPLPDDMVECAGILDELPRSLAPFWTSIRGRFDVVSPSIEERVDTQSTSRLVHPKLESLRIAALKKSEKNAKSAEERWSRHAFALQQQQSNAMLSRSQQIQSTTDQKESKDSRTDFQPDLDLVYALYPRKEGKKRGLAILKKSITTQALYENLRRAAINYAEKCRAERVDAQYQKHFSSWATCWDEYVDYRPIATIGGAQKDPNRSPFEPMPALLVGGKEEL